ncbi:MAG: T9SS type A sorting domain-containing protein [Bacteroidota bacterium]
MKKYIIVSFLTLIFCSGYSQSAYHGGKGDGYAFAEIFIENAGMQNYPVQASVLFPNPVSVGQHVSLKTYSSSSEALHFSVVNILGETINEGLCIGNKAGTFSIPFVFDVKGIYFLSIQSSYKKQLFKLIVN